MTYDDAAVDLIASRCNEPESGGRMIDAILTNTMLPALSEVFLTRMLEGEQIKTVSVGATQSDFAYAYE